MNFKRLAVAALAVAMSVGAAQAITVHRSVTVKASPLWVWLHIGGFCEIADWHPAIAKCDDHWKGGALYRTLSVKGGGTVNEKRTAKAPMSYSYDMLETILPVKNYSATFKVMKGGKGTVIDWKAHFRAKGVSNAKAAAVMAGLFEAGLNKIASEYK